MTPDTRYRLLTIDLDDTLWPCAPVIRLAEEAMHAWLLERAPEVLQAHDAPAMRRHRQALARARPEIAHDLTVVRRDSLRELLEACGYEAALADQAIAVFLDHRNRVEPFAEVVGTLEALAGGYRLVSVTNGNSDVARTPLAGRFHHSLTAAMVGAQKPDPALFLRALEWAGAAPQEALHVGDDPWLDVEAARRVGMGAVWVNRDGREWPQQLPPPEVEVADLGGLLAWLEGPRDAL
jgi:FMN hydrolase / 5-amino-6-(5-phospho-D-ribitylamino)uracil phosphatase